MSKHKNKKRNQQPQPAPQPSQKQLPTITPKYEGKGIVIIALGNSQYGCMAANLAASIRFMDKEVKLHLVHTEQSISRLSDAHKKLFTSMAICPEEYYTKGEKTVYLKAKTCIWELSPFEETILMDADLIWLSDRKGLKAPTMLFESLKDEEFTMQNRGFTDLSKEPLNERYCLWVNIKDVKETYKTNGKF